MNKQHSVGRDWAFVAISILIVAIAYFLPSEAVGLSHEGCLALGVMLAGVVLWFTEALPLTVTGLALLALLPVLGVWSFNDSWSNSVNANTYFLICTFAFTVALSKTTIPTRVIGMVVKWAGTSSSKMILGIMIAVAVLSSVVTNTAAVAMSMPIILKLLDANGGTDEEGNPKKTKLGKALMIASPMAAFAGGAALLCGCGLNIIVVGMTESSFGFTVSFLDWAIVAIPMAIILLIASWFFIVKVIKPEPLSQAAVDASLAEYHALPKLRSSEYIAVFTILLALVLWILSTWFKVFNTAAVALIALGIMFLPGTKVMTFEDFVKGTNWGIVLLVMSVTSMGTAISATGAGSWIATTLLGGLVGMDPNVVLGLSSTLAAVLHNIIPVGPAVAGICVVPLYELAVAAGVSLTATVVMLGWQCGIAFVLPLDMVALIPFSYKQFTFMDYVKVGWFPAIVMILYSCTVLPMLCGMLGLA